MRRRKRIVDGKGYRVMVHFKIARRNEKKKED